MRCCVLVCFVLAASSVYGQHHKLSIDPETKEGYVLQQINQERDPVEKIKMMNEFIVEFPKSQSISWVYDLLLAVYVKAADWERVMALGKLMLEADPDDLDAAHSCLTAAEALKDPDAIRKYAAIAWNVAARLMKTPGYDGAEYARQLITYAEYTVAALANREENPKRRQEAMVYLERINPGSQWLFTSRHQFILLTQQGASKEKLVASAEKGLAADPNDEDMLLTVADYYMARGADPNKVLDYSNRIVEVFKTKKKPETETQEFWEKKKERYLGAAYYMIGVLSSIQGRYAQADRSLRAALPVIRNGSDQALGAALYHLGFANYQLAEKGERERIFDALKFTEQCAGVSSNYRDQARKNIQSIRSEYNLR